MWRTASPAIRQVVQAGSRRVRYPEVRTIWVVRLTGGYGNKLSLSNLSYIGCTHLVECPCQAVAQQGIVKLHLRQHGIHGGGQSFQFQRFVLFAETPAIPVSCSGWKVQAIGIMVHLRIFVFVSDLFGIYNQFRFFRLMRGAEQSIMF